MIIYKIGPESRKVKAKTNDKVWIFIFPYRAPKGSDSKIKLNTVYVSSYKNENSEYKIDLLTPNKLKLSVKHATLISIETLKEEPLLHYVTFDWVYFQQVGHCCYDYRNWDGTS